jgi:hypothetical protein
MYMKGSGKQRKPIAFEMRTVAQENLPLPFVHYPGHYGIFFAFGASLIDTPVFCECSKGAISHYIADRLRVPSPLNSDKRRMFLMDSLSFPAAIVDVVESCGAEMSPNCAEAFQFQPSLCHQCNSAVPSYRWCHEMYGSPFVQNYGWYLEQNRLDLGIFQNWVDYNRCPEEIRELLLLDPNNFFEYQSQLRTQDAKKASELEKQFSRQCRQVHRIVENKVRARMGFRPVGSGSTGEAMLFQLVKRVFPGWAVHRCSRPEFLEGLELDVFLPEIAAAFEFQGQQHFQAINHWGGEDGLRALQQRDERKRKLCYKNGVILLEVRFDEKLTEECLRQQVAREAPSLVENMTKKSVPSQNGLCHAAKNS